MKRKFEETVIPTSRYNPWILFFAQHVWGSAYHHWLHKHDANPADAQSSEIDALHAQIGAHNVNAFTDILGEKILERFSNLIQIYERYLTAVVRPDDENHLSIKQIDSTRLLDYGIKYSPQEEDADAAIIFVPSLINKSYVFDIPENNSILSFLAHNKIHPYVVSWGNFNADGTDLSLESLIEQRLVPLIQSIKTENPKRPVFVLGYCMGGILTLGAYALLKDMINGLLLISVPWDFSLPQKKELYTKILKSIEMQLEYFSYVPGDFIKLLFSFANPVVALKKFHKLSLLSKEEQDHFIQLEDWVNDSVDLPRKIALQCFKNWFVDNDLAMKGQLGGLRINPFNLKSSSFIVIPTYDRIVDATSALPLSDAIQHKTLITPKLGHVGVITARKAKNMVWDPMLQWIQNQSHQYYKENKKCRKD